MLVALPLLLLLSRKSVGDSEVGLVCRRFVAAPTSFAFRSFEDDGFARTAADAPHLTAGAFPETGDGAIFPSRVGNAVMLFRFISAGLDLFLPFVDAPSPPLRPAAFAPALLPRSAFPPLPFRCFPPLEVESLAEDFFDLSTPGCCLHALAIPVFPAASSAAC